MSPNARRMLSTIVVLVVCLGRGVWAQEFAGGTGQPEDPYQIATVDQLMQLARDPNLYDRHFVLVANIDLFGQVHTAAPIAPDVSQLDFVYEGTPFTGTFDGAEHEIGNLTIDIGPPANGFDYLGLFGSLGEGAVIKNLILSGVSIQGGTNSDCLGGLAGYADHATIDNCSVTGSVTSGLNAQCVGGLVGFCEDSTITTCYSACTVAGDENSSLLGGLLGSLRGGTISGCVAAATVQGSTQSAGVGGLIGTCSSTTASDCRSESVVSGGIASHSVGGLIGSGAVVTLQDCRSTEVVSGASVSYRLGGLTGSISSGVLTNCHSAASVEGAVESYEVGGLIGYANDTTVTTCTSTGPVSAGINSDFMGGLIGLLQGTPERMWAETQVVDCSSNSPVTGRDNSDHIGGLIGENGRTGKIYRSHATGAVYGEEEVGGLVGWNEGDIVECYATGNITSAIDADRLGGLVGRNRGHIHGCYATGSVTGDFNSDHLGGLVGKNENRIVNCYATGAVSGGLEAEELGGLVGFNDDSGTLIRRCYATGAVTSLSNADSIGGFVGYHRNGHIQQCFWDIDASGMVNGIGVLGDRQDEDDAVGLTTTEMQDFASFAEWGFADAVNTGLDHEWLMAAGDVGPVLWWQRPDAVPLPTFSGGSGTEDDPYLIADAVDLNSIGYNPRLLDKHYQLVADLDLTAGPQMKMIGNGLHPFAGTFDGSGHTIDNATVVRADYESFAGPFGCVGPGGAVRNLTLAVELAVEHQAYAAVGGLVAYANQATVADCHVVGTISGDDHVGGLIGFGDRCQVTHCSADVAVVGRLHVGALMAYNEQGDVTGCRSQGAVEGLLWCGGLIGDLNKGTLTHSLNAASVSGDLDAGGAVGRALDGQIRFTYNTGPIDGDHSIGGLVGQLSGGEIFHSYSVGAVSGTGTSIGGLVGGGTGEAIECFWDIEASGQSEGRRGEGLSTAQMKDINTYLQAGWDFIDERENGTDDIWFMPEGDYPHLTAEGID